MVLKIGSYGPVEHADEEAIFHTIVDPTCTAWKQALRGAKTGNSKDLQRIEEKRISVLKTVEEHEIPPKQALVDIAGEMEGSTEENKKHVKDLIKRYWAHTSKAHEEAAAAASILRLLADEMDEDHYTTLISVGMRPLNYAACAPNGKTIDGQENGIGKRRESRKSEEYTNRRHH